jgi:ligand-binding sensor domain-containing protein/signal transduction histidine kinase
VLIHGNDEAGRKSFVAIFQHRKQYTMTTRICEKTLNVLSPKNMRAALILLILVPASQVRGQVLNFRNYGVDEGLPDGLVRAMVQDHEGYLWFGTGGGLCRFDGVETKIYSREDGLEAVHIRALCVDRDGNIWIGSRDSGLAIFDGNEFRSLTADLNDIPNPGVINVINVDSAGDIWVGARNGLYQFSDGPPNRFSVDDGLPANAVWSLHEDAEKNLWVGAFWGLCRYSDDAFEYVAVDPTSDHVTIMGIAEDHDGTLWVGTDKRGLFRSDDQGFRKVPLSKQSGSSRILNLLHDQQGNLWVGTRDGSFKRDGDTFASYGENKGGPGGYISEIFEDKEANLWFCSRSSVAMLATEAITSFPTSSPLSSRLIDVVMARNNGEIWVAARDSVHRISAGTSSVFRIGDGGQSPMTTRILETQSGAILLATLGAGIFEFSDGQLNPFDWHDGPTPGDIVTDMFEDHEGGLWISSRTDLYRYHDGELTSFQQNDDAPVDNFRSTVFLQDRQNAVWIGTRTGISKYAQGEFAHYALPDSQYGNEVTCLLKDDGGFLWVGTRHGLRRFSDGQFTEVTPVDSFSSKVCRTLLREGSCLYVGMPNGLNRLDLNTMQVRVYTIRHGLAGSMISKRGLSRDRQGNIWIGTANGLSCLRPVLARSDVSPPLIHISEIALHDRKLSLNDRTELPYDDNNIKFEFVGLSYTSPEDVLYQHRMEGVDRDWIETSERSASYPFLPPGPYRFEVKARNGNGNGGAWSERSAFFEFVIHPPFWATWWFRGAGVSTLLAVVVTAHRMRYSAWKKRNSRLQGEITERIQAEEATRLAQQKLLNRHYHEAEIVDAKLKDLSQQLVRKTRLATIGRMTSSIAHEIGNPLGAVRNAAYLLKRKFSTGNAKQDQYLSIINSEVNKADRVIRDMLTMASSKAPSKLWFDVSTVVREAFDQVSVNTSVRLEFACSPERNMIIADRNQMRQVIGNLLSNSVQAMDGNGEVRVELREDGNHDLLFVQDSGPGVNPDHRAKLFEPLFSTKAKGTGLGLAICRQIIESHGGTVELQDHEGSGALFCMRLPRTTRRQ